MSEEIVSSSQTETDPTETERDAATEALYEQFQLPKPNAVKEEIKFPEATEETEDDPAIDQDEEKSTATEGKKRVVKFNKEDREIDETEVDELLQKGLGLDKVREQKTELEKTLDRAAKLAGFNNHLDYVANLDKLEQQQQQNQQTALDKMKNDLLDELVEVGNLDREKAEQYIENHPLFQEGKKALELSKQQAQKSAEVSKWQPLYQAYPELLETVQKANGQPVEWYTPELQALVERGNDPLLAYEHLNKETLQTTNKKQMEQRLIKQQQLGARSQVQGNTATESTEPTLLPSQISLAAEFGVDIKEVNRQQKLINSRR